MTKPTDTEEMPAFNQAYAAAMLEAMALHMGVGATQYVLQESELPRFLEWVKELLETRGEEMSDKWTAENLHMTFRALKALETRAINQLEVVRVVNRLRDMLTGDEG